MAGNETATIDCVYCLGTGYDYSTDRRCVCQVKDMGVQTRFDFGLDRRGRTRVRRTTVYADGRRRVTLMAVA